MAAYRHRNARFDSTVASHRIRQDRRDQRGDHQQGGGREPLQLQPLVTRRPGEPHHSRRDADHQRDRHQDENHGQARRGAARRQNELNGCGPDPGGADQLRHRDQREHHGHEPGGRAPPPGTQPPGREQQQQERQRRRSGSPRSSWRARRPPGPPAATRAPRPGPAAAYGPRRLLSPSPRPAARNNQPIRFAGRRDARTKPTTGTAMFTTSPKTSERSQSSGWPGTRCRSA